MCEQGLNELPCICRYATLVRQDCTLELDMSYFQDSIIPEHIESMWGPVPLPPLPPGVNNMCQVADHK